MQGSPERMGQRPANADRTSQYETGDERQTRAPVADIRLPITETEGASALLSPVLVCSIQGRGPKVRVRQNYR